MTRSSGRALRCAGGAEPGAGRRVNAPIEEVPRILEGGPLQQGLYSDEVFDCGDHGFVLVGLVLLHARSLEGVTTSKSLGIAWGAFDSVDDFRATNWVRLEDGGFQWFDVRTGQGPPGRLPI